MFNEDKSKEIIKVAGYCRFSSDMQTEDSISAQKRIILFHLHQNMKDSFDIEWYCDEAKSGKTTNRPNFQKMIMDAKQGKLQIVICHKLDRFSRNTSDTLEYKELLKKYGVELITVAEQLKDDASGKLMLTVMAGINQYYIDNLANEIRKGMNETAHKCEHTGGTPPLGFNVDTITKKLVINEAEAEIVRLIFKMASDGYGYGAILDELNALGRKTKKDNSFGKNSLYSILHNEKYKGDYVFGLASSDQRGKRNTHPKNKIDNNIIRIPNGCPQIVDEDIWEKANALTRINGSDSTNAKHQYLFTNLLYCKECGSKLHGNHRHNKSSGSHYSSYRCCRRDNNRTCDLKELRCEVLDDWVIDQLCKHLLSDSMMPYITEQLNEHLKEQAHNSSDYADYKDTLKGLVKSRNNLIEVITKSGYSQAINDKLEEIEAEIVKCKTCIEACEKAKDYFVTVDEIKSQIGNFKNFLKDPNNILQAKLMLKQFIDKIEISNNEVKVTFIVTFSFFLENTNMIKIPYKKTSSSYISDLFKRFRKLSDFDKTQTSLERLSKYLNNIKSCSNVAQGVPTIASNRAETIYCTM